MEGLCHWDVTPEGSSGGLVLKAEILAHSVSFLDLHVALSPPQPHQEGVREGGKKGGKEGGKRKRNPPIVFP